MFPRRTPLLALMTAATISVAFAAPASAERKSLREMFFPSKVEKTEDAQKPAKKVKLRDGARQKQQAATKPKGGVAGVDMPGVDMAVRPQGEEASPGDVQLVSGGNNGELRSETQPKKVGLFGALFGRKTQIAQMLPQTRALDSVLAQKESRKKFKVKEDFLPQEVEFSGYPTGTIVIDTGTRYLYLVESASTARRYAIAVGREGLLFTGKATVGDKQEWPRWIPTADMQKREPRKYGQYKDGMPGGAENPLGARAIYLFQGKRDTHIRIHGTNQPQSIGRAASNGCFRMVNEHVMDLYSRVRMGTPVVVL